MHYGKTLISHFSIAYVSLNPFIILINLYLALYNFIKAYKNNSGQLIICFID